MDQRLTDFERLRSSADQFKIAVDGLELPLKRHRGRGGGGPPVLLLHGGSTCSDIFLVPGGGLVQYLLNRGWEVWTLDWRGSCRVVDDLKGSVGGSVEAERALFTLDAVALQDIPLALSKMREHIDADQKIGIVGFCAGSGALAMAMARGMLRDLGVDNVVLMTLGLFYETPWDGWIKAEDFLIERLMVQDPERRGVSPHQTPWAADMEAAFARWPKAWLAALSASSAVQAMYRRLSFMFGEPYAPGSNPDIPSSVLLELFGSLHLGLYLHLGQQVRRGYAAPFDAPDILDRSRLPTLEASQPNDDLRPEPFYDGRVALIGGAQNRLWHRDSIDLMYDWLRSNAPARFRRSALKKHILRDYAHLDLLWGERAREEVYPLIQDGLDPGRGSDGLLKSAEARPAARA